MEENQVKIPEGWENDCVGSILVSQNDKSKQLKSNEYLASGTFPIIDQSERLICGYTENQEKVISKNLPLVIFGDHTRHTKFIDFPFVCGADGTQLLKASSKLYHKFFYFLVCNASLLIGNHGYDRHFKHLKNFNVIYPKSITEQQKIAEILGKVDTAIEQTKTLIAKYRRIKTGLMQDLLTKGIDEQGNIRSEETHEFKDSELGRIPNDWSIITLGQLSEINSGITLGKKYEGLNTIVLPYLRVANVQDGYLDLQEIKYLRVPSSFLEKYKLEKGDVLMNEGGDNDKLGRGTIWDNEIKNCLHQNHVFRVRTYVKDLLPDYLTLYSGSFHGKSFFLVSSKQSTNLASININLLKCFPILLPNIDEQKRIIKALRQHNKAITENTNQLLKFQKLKTALMQDLLSGKKRVTPLLTENEQTNG